jgi:hypothetical protein
MAAPPRPKELCRLFLSGNCGFGDRCRYLHAGEERAQRRDGKSAVRTSACERRRMRCGPAF